MKMSTIPEAAKALNVSSSTLRRAVTDGRIPSMHLGNRTLIDIDAVRETFKQPQGVKIEEVSRETGLSIGSIRRAITEGWMPCKKYGQCYYFHLPDVVAAIQQQLDEQQKNR